MSIQVHVNVELQTPWDHVEVSIAKGVLYTEIVPGNVVTLSSLLDATHLKV